jgi:hypothetical protein
MSLFLRIGGSLLLNNIVSYLIITILLHFGFNDWKRSAIYSAIILVIINLVHHIGYTTEGYDNLDDALKKLAALGDSKHETKEEPKKKKDAKEKDTKETKKGIPVVTMNGKTQPVEEFNQLDDEEKAKLYKSLGTENKAVKRESAVAQRDLYQLIDTVKQLQETVDHLGPTLKEGKKIMDAFENIKME